MPWPAGGSAPTSVSVRTSATPRRRWRAAVEALDALPGVRLRGVSRLYATAPVGVTDQPEFRNAVVALDVPAGPDPASGAPGLLASLKDLERAFGRQRRGRWGPRELDLDLLVFGRARLAIERPPDGRSLDAETDPARPRSSWRSRIARPRERLFVLAPLADLAPGLVPPGWGETVETAAAVRRASRAPTRSARSRPGTCRAAMARRDGPAHGRQPR